MAQHHDDDPYFDAFDEDGLLRDGKRARVSLMMKDAAMARGAATRFDDRKPGPVYCDRSISRQAYEDAVREGEQAWRDVGEGQPRGAKQGDACTIDGAPGRLDAKLRCIPDRQDAMPRTFRDAAEARQIKQAALHEMIAEMTNAWRSP